MTRSSRQHSSSAPSIIAHRKVQVEHKVQVQASQKVKELDTCLLFRGWDIFEGWTQVFRGRDTWPAPGVSLHGTDENLLVYW